MKYQYIDHFEAENGYWFTPLSPTITTGLHGELNCYVLPCFILPSSVYPRFADSQPHVKIGHLRGKAGLFRGKVFAVSLTSDPALCGGSIEGITAKEWEAIVGFIKINQPILLRHWKGECETEDLFWGGLEKWHG